MNNSANRITTSGIRGVSSLGALVCLAFLSFGAGAADQSGNTAAKLNDAWIDGKLEASYLLNRHLNSFVIDTDVKNGVVTLSGTVQTEIDKNLAGEIAKGIEGVKKVDNRMRIDPNNDARRKASADSKRSVGQVIDDATTTAIIKSKLLSDSTVSGLAIDIDTYKDTVTLTGTVETEEKRALIEQIAKNVRMVQGVENQIVVNPNS